MKERLLNIAACLDEGRRISKEDTEFLWHNASDEDLKHLSLKVRNRFHEKDVATYVIMRIINYTNVCIAKCDYCAFYRSANSHDAYVLSKETIFSKIDELIDIGGELVCFNGGFNPNLRIDFYADLFSSIVRRYGEAIEFYAMTVVELIYVARVSKLTVRQAIEVLKRAGVRWITGGGAEILCDGFRARHSPHKYSVKEYLAAQRDILAAGLNSTATMVIGFDESFKERMEHLEALRQFQDEIKMSLSRELFSFLCWTYKPMNTGLAGKEIDNREYLRHLAICRIYLDNIVHIRSSVLTQNENALRALEFGADDFDLPWEDEVTEMAGAVIDRDLGKICTCVEQMGFLPRMRPLAVGAQQIGAAKALQ